MFVDDDDFYFTVTELYRYGYALYTSKQDTYIYGKGSCHSVMTILSTQAAVVFENVSGRIAACPHEFFSGWSSYVPITLRLPRSILEVSYFVECLERLEKDHNLWRNPMEQMNTYDYGKVYQLK